MTSSASSSIPSSSSDEDHEFITPSTVPTLHDLGLDSDYPLQAGAQPLHPIDPSVNARVSVIQGDITEFAVDVVVNAANESLLGGGGVDGAIHQAAGPGLVQACRPLGGCDTGDAKMTDAFDLPCKRICHTVGPIFRKQSEEESERLLRSCYQTSLELTVGEGLQTIAFCSISTGIYGYPMVSATHTALSTIRSFLESPAGASIERVIFVVFSRKDESVYRSVLPYYFPCRAPAPGEDGDEIEGEMDDAEEGEEAEGSKTGATQGGLQGRAKAGEGTLEGGRAGPGKGDEDEEAQTNDLPPPPPRASSTEAV